MDSWLVKQSEPVQSDIDVLGEQLVVQWMVLLRMEDERDRGNCGKISAGLFTACCEGNCDGTFV
jgi:hypothetical protein